MALPAGGIIDQARGRHSAFDHSRHTNKVVLQFLSSYVKELHGKVTKRDPDILRTEQLQAMPLAVHDDGIPLLPERMVVEVVARDAQMSDIPVDLIPATQRLDRGIRAASAWQIGAVLFLTSPAALWARVVQLGIATVRLPVPLATLADTIALPDAAELALVEATAYFMAKRLPMDAKAPTLDVSVFRECAKDSEEAFLDDISNRFTGTVIRTRDVYDP